MKSLGRREAMRKEIIAVACIAETP